MDVQTEDDVNLDSVAWGWRDYFSQLSELFRELERQRGIATHTYAQYAFDRLENCERVIQHLNDILTQADIGSTDSSVLSCYRERFSALLELVLVLRVQWQQYCASTEAQFEMSRYHAPREHGQLGRPRVVILQDQLEYLRSLSFTWEEIAAIFTVSRMTIYRHRVEYDMLEDPGQIPSDHELTLIVEEIRQQLPYLGEVMVMGRLRAMGYHVRKPRATFARSRSHLRVHVRERTLPLAARWCCALMLVRLRAYVRTH